MKKTIAFILISLFLAITSPIAHANLIPDSYRGVEYSFKIENIDKYSNYKFFLFTELGSTRKNYSIINQGQELTFYKINKPQIYAIKKADFANNNIELAIRDNLERLDKGLKINKESESKLDNYFSNNAIKSYVEIHLLGAVKINDSREKIVDVLNVFKIKSITNNNLKIELSKVINVYTNGTTKTYPRPNSDKRNPTKTIITRVIYWTAIPLSALIAILAVVFSRRRGKSNEAL